MTDKVITIDGLSHELPLERDGNQFTAGDERIELLEVRGNEALIRSGGRTHVVPFAIRGAEVSFSYDGEIYTAEVAEKGARARAKHRDHSTAAPMPGLVLKVLVEAGAVVDKGAPLVILEAMKMEHTIVAPSDSRVVSVNCSAGELVQPGFELIDLEKLAPPVPNP